MYSLKTFLVTCVVTCLVTAAAADDLTDRYYKDLATYLELEIDSMDSVVAVGLPAEELPVVFAVAEATSSKPVRIAKIRSEGSSWDDIMRVRGTSSEILYFMLVGTFDSKTYTPIFAKFDGLPQENWQLVKLSDEEVIALANLRFIYKRHDFSVFKIMAFRDQGKDFVAINKTVSQLRDEQIKKDKAKLRREKEASKDEES